MELLLNQVIQRLDELVQPRHSTLRPEVLSALVPGKLFRPQLALRVAAALGLPAPGAALQAAVPAELLHMSSLIHDDLMDGSPHRRGLPAVHVAAGASTAIAIGNLLLARAASVVAAVAPGCFRSFLRALELLWEGQLIEQSLAIGTSRATHVQYIGMKTAAPMAATCEMAALSQGADEHRSAQLARFVHGVGMAFQVADDLLDHIGDSATTGKTVGTDTSRGVVSLGAWHALTLAGATFESVGRDELNLLAAQDEPINHALDAIDAYLDAAHSALSDAVIQDNSVWSHPRSQMARMLLSGVRTDHRDLVVWAVSRWPE